MEVIVVSWEKVTRPLSLGGLGIPNLIYKGWALQMWLWLQKTDQHRPWCGGAAWTSPSSHRSRSCLIARLSLEGNGNNTRFWTDRWLNENSISILAPEVFYKVDKRAIKSRTVAEALEDRSWVRDIRSPLSLVGIQQYLVLWDFLEEVALNDDEDKHEWRHEASGCFSPASCNPAIRSYLWAPSRLSHGRDYGNRGHLQNARCFFGWP
ncbi:Plant UBX domain-containing protein 2 [Zea mays]|jgi:hypothetical protein|uniref:Plant UBX domain-containing protein 2 n=1 Tax=Zea mays TaxID=4577 RepID=A0A1D6I412_MAIZE|nr:Plant UBX domain-containing protein 2 [Zea mays]